MEFNEEGVDVCKTYNKITHADEAWLANTYMYIINYYPLSKLFELEINLQYAQVYYMNII